MLHFRTIWLVIGGFMLAAVWVASLLPVPEQLKFEITHIDKIEHFVVYFILMAWYAQLYHKQITRIIYAVGFVVMGITIEILQGMGKVRMFDPLDIVANSAGVLLAWLFVKNSWATMLQRFESWAMQ